MYNPNSRQIVGNWIFWFLKFYEVSTGNLSELETKILQQTRLSQLDLYFNSLDITLRRNDRVYQLHVERPPAYGPAIEFITVDNLTPEDIADYNTMAKLVADALGCQLGDIDIQTKDKKKRLVPNIPLESKDTKRPYPLSTIADHLVAYRKIGEVEMAIGLYRYVPRYLCDQAISASLPLNVLKVKPPRD